MNTFTSFGAFAMHVATTMTVGALAEVERGLEACAKHVEAVAKDKMGHYQSRIGPFPGWAELSPVTSEDRLKRGYTPNDPLLVTGQLRDAITHETDRLVAVIGVKPGAHIDYHTGEIADNGQIMTDHEFGTHYTPPRPVLGPAALESDHWIQERLGNALTRGLVGQYVHASGDHDLIYTRATTETAAE